MRKWFQFWVDYFIVWVLLFSSVAYIVPDPFAALKPAILPGLGVIMFGMGATLNPEDFARVAKMPRAVACGLIGQFLIMPLLAVGLATVLGLAPELALGLVILGSCPGGTASNVIAYLAKADVALSVTMTACSTLAAVLATPYLVYFLGGDYLPVDPLAMLQTVAVVVLIPVCAGLALHVLFRERVDRAMAVFPSVSVLVIVLIVAAIVALNREKLGQVLGVLGVAVVLHNILGVTLGYALATLARLPHAARRTVAIEVGMQNSGLGVGLAGAHYAAQPLVALPSALFSVVHNVTGSMLATIWRRTPTGQSDTDKPSQPPTPGS